MKRINVPINVHTPFTPKFQPGDKAALTGLIGNPQDNGRQVTIKALRLLKPLEQNPHCPSGRAYYLEEPVSWADWVYEERLKHLQ